MNFKPMFDRVLVKQDPAETKTSSGFIIPDSTAEKTNTGTVIAVGPGKAIKDGSILPLTVQPNDKIMFAPGNGIRVKVEGEELLVLNEDDIIAVVND
jgi:chaperonin GroES